MDDLSNELFKAEGQAAFEAKLAEAEADTRAGRVRPMADVQRDARSMLGSQPECRC